MAKSKTATAVKKEPVVHVLNEELHTEIEGITTAARKSVVVDESENVIIPEAELGMAANLLALSRALIRNAKADYDTKIKNIVDPFKPFATEKKDITKRAEAVEQLLVCGLHKLVAEGKLGVNGVETAAGVRLSLVGKRELVLDDPALIPDEYLLPRAQCLDWGKIKQQIEANEKAIEAAAEAGITLDMLNPIQGAHLVTNYTFRTKLPDELES